MDTRPIDMHRRALAAALALLPVLAGCASGRRSQLALDDEVLALRAAGLGLYELSVAQQVQARAQRPELQAFARILAEHHAAANAELLGLLQSRGIEPPAAMPAYLELRLARLQADAGDGSDRRFVQVAGLQDQERLVALHEHASLAVADAALRAWFVGQLPALRSHLAIVRSLAAPPPDAESLLQQTRACTDRRCRRGAYSQARARCAVCLGAPPGRSEPCDLRSLRHPAPAVAAAAAAAAAVAARPAAAARAAAPRPAASPAAVPAPPAAAPARPRANARWAVAAVAAAAAAAAAARAAEAKGRRDAAPTGGVAAALPMRQPAPSPWPTIGSDA